MDINDLNILVGGFSEAQITHRMGEGLETASERFRMNPPPPLSLVLLERVVFALPNVYRLLTDLVFSVWYTHVCGMDRWVLIRQE